MAGLAALEGTAWADTEVRLLAAGARAAADLAALPRIAWPRDIAEPWEPMAATFADRAQAILAAGRGGEPAIAAFAALAAAEHARQFGSDDRATWRAVAGAWQVAGEP